MIVNAGALALIVSSVLAAQAQPAQPTQAAQDPAQQPAQPAQPAQLVQQAATPQEPEDHRAQLESFNTRINEVEGKILLAKEKVDLLRDTILGGTISRSRAVIVHRNEMGTSFVLEKAIYMLDGGVIFNREDTGGALDANKEFEVYNGPMNPGEHEISVAMVYAGSTHGFFTYLKGYKFKVESKYRFNVLEGRLTTLTVVSYAKGDITVESTDKIAVRYDVELGNVPASQSIKLDTKPAAKTAPETKPAETKPADTKPAETAPAKP